MRTLGCSDKGFPTPAPSPLTRLNTPLGTPTLSKISAKITAANGVSSDGLAGYVIGKDKETLHKVARSIEAGTVEINEAGRKPDLPFGGYKQSGLGREWGDYGIEEFLEVKSIAGYFK